MIESAASEFRTTKSYLDCLRLTSHLRRPDKFIKYSDPKERGMKIEAKNLHFGYSDQPDGKEVLRNISFKIHAGETIGIVGYNGYYLDFHILQKSRKIYAREPFMSIIRFNERGTYY